MEHFDVIVLGGGPGGERAAVQAARAGKRVALIERERQVGGTCVNWGAIPSKTLRESALFVHSVGGVSQHGIVCRLPQEITIADFMWRERVVVQRELELINRSLDEHAVQIFRGTARFVDPHTVAIVDADGRTRVQYAASVCVIATGASPHHPPDVPFDEECVFDSDTILRMPRMPRSMLVLGAGVIGVEYAAIFAALGIQVTLLDTREVLLPYLDREIADLLERELRKLGVAILHGDRYQTIAKVTPENERRAFRDGGGSASDRPFVRCRTRQGNVIETDVLLYNVGRVGNTASLGLEAVGLTADERGLLRVNADYQTTHPHIYAVGDVIGYPALASTSAEQGRQAIRHALGLPGPRVRTELLPFAIFAIPEVSYLGDTEEELQRAQVPYVVGRGRYGSNPRGQIAGDTTGLLKLLFERPGLRLRGVHVIGLGASELVHVGQAFLHHGGTAEEIAETLFNYPTLADLYRQAAFEALQASRRGGEGTGADR